MASALLLSRTHALPHAYLETSVMHPMPESWFDNADLHMAPVVAAWALGLLMLLLSYAQG